MNSIVVHPQQILTYGHLLYDTVATIAKKVLYDTNSHEENDHHDMELGHSASAPDLPMPTHEDSLAYDHEISYLIAPTYPIFRNSTDYDRYPVYIRVFRDLCIFFFSITRLLLSIALIFVPYRQSHTSIHANNARSNRIHGGHGPGPSRHDSGVNNHSSNHSNGSNDSGSVSSSSAAGPTPASTQSLHTDALDSNSNTNTGITMTNTASVSDIPHSTPHTHTHSHHHYPHASSSPHCACLSTYDPLNTWTVPLAAAPVSYPKFQRQQQPVSVSLMVVLTFGYIIGISYVVDHTFALALAPFPSFMLSVLITLLLSPLLLFGVIPRISHVFAAVVVVMVVRVILGVFNGIYAYE
jgi:hypothetical protein